MGIARYEIRQPKKGTAADWSEDKTTGRSEKAAGRGREEKITST
jgi:hypothetical protein